MRKTAKFLLVLIGMVFIAAGCNRSAVKEQTPLSQEQPVEKDLTVKFSEINSTYKFSGKIDKDWKVEYIRSIESINIYDSSIENESSLEQSQIFIRYFKANSFLTLSTVEILSREEAEISGHSAIRYGIKKKAGVANFLNQPSWRSSQHKLIDIRHSPSNPSLFYVFAYNPSLSPDVFEEFIQSIEFEN